MGLQFLFMDDNAPCHRTVAAEQLLESRRLKARTLPPVTIRELRLVLQDEWAAMPQHLIDTLILSMGRRCETCLALEEPPLDTITLRRVISTNVWMMGSGIFLHLALRKRNSIGRPVCTQFIATPHTFQSGPRNMTTGVVCLEVTMIQRLKLPQHRKHVVV
ncbi:hypothetical protein TNCV_2711371 [Trichonephila clavipes]|nr:hypothetical protein TNCV_2711371 [Trichonephila clavipes]